MSCLGNGALKTIIAHKNMSTEAKMALHNGVLVPTLMYGSEAWTWQKKDETKLNAVEMRSQKNVWKNSI